MEMASRTAVSALPWHHSMLDVDARAGLAGATLGLGAENRRRALTLRNRRYCTSIFHDDDRPRLPAAKSGGGPMEAFLPPATPLLPLEHELSEAGVLWAERYSGDEGDDRGALGRRRPSRMIWLALTSTGDGGSLLTLPPPGKPNSKSLSGGGAVVPRSASANGGIACALRLSQPREKLSPRCCSEATSMSAAGRRARVTRARGDGGARHSRTHRAAPVHPRPPRGRAAAPSRAPRPPRRDPVARRRQTPSGLRRQVYPRSRAALRPLCSRRSALAALRRRRSPTRRPPPLGPRPLPGSPRPPPGLPAAPHRE
ncbi:hypothetical protein SETIT_5G436300v2 [Setaria italica]|uniref:Uncharacterized protein n=1 Tax=Setaria italica TaxID=4555 RepID=A0A368RFK9_SETIT|nr:hypothetical protein SETIT_5G436300v2 [Setaria italica]RCV28854.1 hypothetical protein SETIT_5G436300v2 [Setaria italica]